MNMNSEQKGVPAGWKTRRLGDCIIGNPQYGANAPSIEFANNLPRYVRITDILTDGNLSGDRRSIPNELANDYLLNRGDVLFARSGATVGKTYLHKTDNGRYAFAGYLIRVVPNQTILLPEYLKYTTETRRYWAWVQNTLRAGAQPNINANEYAAFNIYCPPLPEQKKIAEILSCWDRGIEKIDNLVQKRVKKLQLLINSIFIPDCQSLIEGVGKSNWDLLPMSEVADINPLQLRESDTDPNNQFYYVDLSSVKTGQIDYPSEVMLFKDAPSRARRVVEENDILISNVRPNLKGFAMHEKRIEEMVVCSTGFSVLRPKKQCFKSLIYFAFLSQEIDRQISSLTTGSNYPAISSVEVGNLTACFPRDLDQARIIGAILENENQVIVKLKHMKACLQAQKQGLTQKLLTGKVRVTIN